MEEIIDIQGMHCKSCVDKIESKLKSLDGIVNIKVSLSENKAFVQFDPKKISLDKIKLEIQSLGYSISENNKIINEKRKKGILQGVAYGLIPHIGCITFIISSILGVTVLTQFFKPFLMNPYFFHILIIISLGFATLSSLLYLRKNGLLSKVGMKRKWKYLSTMYGSTIGINLLLFLVIFPLLANVSFGQTQNGNLAVSNSSGFNTLSSLKLQVDIPCSGHASLITSELKTIVGVSEVQFSLPNIFDVSYDSSKTSKQQILALEVFKTYKATVLSDVSNQASDNQLTQNQQIPNYGCCGGGSCGCGGR